MDPIPNMSLKWFLINPKCVLRAYDFDFDIHDRYYKSLFNFSFIALKARNPQLSSCFCEQTTRNSEMCIDSFPFSLSITSVRLTQKSFVTESRVVRVQLNSRKTTG